MKNLPRALRAFALLAALLAGLACEQFSPAAPTPTPTLFPNERPADFTARYDWSEGSLPPPYHYAYTIEVASDGTATLTFIPDYPGDDVPVWTETVSLTPTEMDALYADLAAYGLFTTDWKKQDDPPVGGSSETLSATANGVTVSVPAYVVPEQAADEAALAATLHDVIPDDIWATLNARRDDYVTAHSSQ